MKKGILSVKEYAFKFNHYLVMLLKFVYYEVLNEDVFVGYYS